MIPSRPSQDRQTGRSDTKKIRRFSYAALRHHIGGLRSAGVRFALGYAVLFWVSAVLFLSVIWWGTAGLLERQVEASVSADARALSERWTDGGLSALALTIEDRLEDNVDDDALYLLVDPKNQRVAGNLSVWPADVAMSGVWYQLTIRRAGSRGVAEVQAFDLPSGYRLLVGRDVRGRTNLRRLLTDTLLWAWVVITILTFVGALLVRNMFRRMISSIARTTSAIAHGDMSRRMALSGRGDELDEVAEAINEMLDRIARLMDGVKQVSNAIAHDLRTPITRARAQLEYAALHAHDEAGLRSAIENGVSDLDNITAVFEALLRIAQIEAGSRRSAFASFDLIPVLQDIVELYEPVADEQSIRIIPRMPGHLPFYGDRSMIQQAASNLLDNAIKFSPHGGTITVSAAIGPELSYDGKADGQTVTVAVTDEGVGMSEADLERASERFFRADSARNTPGSGLGLSLVQAIAQLHGGTLQFVRRSPGLAVEMQLPLCGTSRMPPVPDMTQDSQSSHPPDMPMMIENHI
ncbi:two-component sensor histidine kinase [Acetobacter oeni]|uniref:histidine kinase n=1 Tax=Acetobacter oeni TaxID=304077 RepID=A0A511XJM1_9PROT|nr:signal transduction histidine kinase [Acetobacter oeni]NHO19492.1 HAMP domain-containing protein [Acetobacter oeni]GEN63121.1 two-component sensor histidine kinase [Acetobacter oeni]